MCVSTHAYTQHTPKKIKKGNKYHRDQQNQTVRKLYSLVSSRKEFLLSYRDEGRGKLSNESETLRCV